MIKEYVIEVVLHSSNIKHYENLYYPIPRSINNRGKLTVKRGTKIKVFVFDLPKNSETKITAICECPTCPNPERILSFRDYTDICKICSDHSEEHRLQQIGENNPNWNPNLTDEERAERKENRTLNPEFKEWSRKVKERDNFKCCVPGCNNQELESHHLDNWIDFPEKRYDIDNGVTLCEDHHRNANDYSFHTKFGIKGNIKEQFIEWIDMLKI